MTQHTRTQTALQHELPEEKENRTTTPQWILWVGATFCCMLWGLAPALIKVGYAQMGIETTGQIVVFAGTRFFLSGLLVLAYYRLSSHQKIRIRKSEICPILLLALFQTFGQYFFFYMGAANASGIMTSIFTATNAMFALLISACLFHLEKLTLLKAAGCVIGFLGVVLMNFSPSGMTFSLQGEGMLLCSSICSACSAVLIKVFSKDSSPVLLSGAQFTIGGLALILFGFCLPDHTVAWNGGGMLVLLILSLISAGAYTIWGILLSKFPVSSVSVFSCTNGIFGILFSAMILGESLTIKVFYAAILTSLGVLMINAAKPEGKKHRKQKAVNG